MRKCMRSPCGAVCRGVRRITTVASPSPSYSFSSTRPLPLCSSLPPSVVRLEPEPRQAVQLSDNPRAPPVARQLKGVLAREGLPHPVQDMTRLSSHLKRISAVNQNAIPCFVPPSSDQRLGSLAVEHGCRFGASTSSITSMLSQLHFLFTHGKGVNLGCLSHHFRDLDNSFAPSALKPTSLFLRKRQVKDQTIHVLDGDPGINPPDHQILMDLGKVMELMVTNEAEDFWKLTSPDKDVTPKGPDSFNFLKVGDLLVRSQIDAYDEDMGLTLDIKSRATIPIRNDIKNYLKHKGYRIKYMEGPTESYEREFYDMMRTVFPKYAFQMRIGQMDGALVLYHNTDEIFGYEYVTLTKIDECTFGSVHMAERGFDIYVALALAMLKHIIQTMDGPATHIVLWYNRVEDVLEILLSPVTNDLGWTEGVLTPTATNQLGADHGWQEPPAARFEAAAKVSPPQGAIALAMHLHVMVNGQRMFRAFDFTPEDHVEVFYEIRPAERLFLLYEMKRWGDGFHQDYFTF
eukprot:c11187_g1_i2.p1 GENE.c11187_g1_i2~~c11187_g1_i2.p1  ORF type:complete len:517 (-),score=110.20 c11187_g1_i2:48-1598(-)